MHEPRRERFTAPTPSDLGDREVEREGDSLDGVRVALLVTGSIAAFKAPLVARALRRQGASVRAFASSEALRYVTADALSWACAAPTVIELTPESEHLSDDAPYDVYLCAPATLNTISKLACGIADGTVTAALASALGRMERGRAGVLLAPCMHGSMHTSILERHVEALASMGVRIVPPRDAAGKHNLPDEAVLVAAVVDDVRRRKSTRAGGRERNA
ncbi:MAG: hypothetical protein FJ253_06030 [Phycisphaerae bacterium]|nr:hypothetical protein [Phycisphaerae bacterium]